MSGACCILPVLFWFSLNARNRIRMHRQCRVTVVVGYATVVVGYATFVVGYATVGGGCCRHTQSPLLVYPQRPTTGVKTRVFLRGGGVQGGWMGGAVGGDPPPPGDPELLEAPKAPKKLFGLN